MQVESGDVGPYRCGSRPSSCLFCSDLASDMGEPCGSIALKGSSCLMGFLYDADEERQPLPSFYSDILSRTYTHTHTHLLYSHSFCPSCRDWECTQIYTHIKHTHTYCTHAALHTNEKEGELRRRCTTNSCVIAFEKRLLSEAVIDWSLPRTTRLLSVWEEARAAVIITGLTVVSLY